jgi:hypothetical protein
MVLLSLAAMIRQEQKHNTPTNPAVKQFILEDDCKASARLPRNQRYTGWKLRVRRDAEVVISIFGCCDKKGATANSADKNWKSPICCNWLGMTGLCPVRLGSWYRERQANCRGDESDGVVGAKNVIIVNHDAERRGKIHRQ